MRTEESYISWIKRFIFYHNKRHPTEMGESEIGQFITYLSKDQNVSAYTQNQALCAIVFLYKSVLKKGEEDRITMLHKKIIEPLKIHLEKVKDIHQKDFANGFGSVYLPYAIERKYPNAKYD